jgi:bifunctional UDP-N-acetylglucosamine pyrophosphorylase/glucosamine-1-phosphate N-acetyltransferase
MTEFTAVILAAGEGTRMKSELPKVLHPLCGVPMLSHVIASARAAGARQVAIVVGAGAEEIRDAFRGQEVDFVLQAEQKGTGHALMQAEEAVRGSERIVVLYGDMPLVRPESIAGMVDTHCKTKAAATVMTAEVSNPTGYGRIIRKGHEVLAIREEKDASPAEKSIAEINSGFYCFDTQRVFEALTQVGNDNRQGEYYLTDVVEILNRQGHHVAAFELQDPEELHGVNNRRQLAKARELMQRRIIDDLMDRGVTFINPGNTVIDIDVDIGQDTVIYPGAVLQGDTVIGSRCTIIGPSLIRNSRIGDDVLINMSQVDESHIREGVKIGPFVNIRPGCQIGPQVKIGDFVEIKNTQIGEGTKVPHLSYVGDAVLGKGINIGAGVIFVNYDGREKHRTIIEDDAFIGCNSNLVAPLHIDKKSYIAAGSTITKDVPEGALGIARARQENKIGWIEKRSKIIKGGTQGNGK